jgi:hypothetical protein
MLLSLSLSLDNSLSLSHFLSRKFRSLPFSQVNFILALSYLNFTSLSHVNVTLFHSLIGVPMGGDKEAVGFGPLLLQLLGKFSKTFGDTLDGRSPEVSTVLTF